MGNIGQFSWNVARHNPAILALGAVLLAGCGDRDQKPEIVTTSTAPDSGGVSGGPLVDTLTVHALDADTGVAIPDAYVTLGSGQNARKVGRTGGDGTLVVSGLDGSPQMVSVNAPGYATATWGLVKSATARIPLETTASPPADATVNLSIPGWSDLPPVADGNYRIARFAFSRPRGIEALEASLSSAGPDCTDANMPCAVTLNVPIDSTALLAEIAEGSAAGTPKDPSDDTLAVTGLGIQTGIQLHADTPFTLALPLLDATSLAAAKLEAVPPTQNVFEEPIGVPGISLDGQLLLYPSLGPLATSFLVPTATGPFVNAKLWAVATTNNANGTAWSRVYERGIDPPHGSSAPIDLETTSFIDAPSLTKTGDFSFTLGGEANVQRMEFVTASGQRLDVLLFPAQPELDIPQGLLDGPPVSVSVESFDLEIDATEFDYSDLSRQSTRISYTRVDQL